MVSLMVAGQSGLALLALGTLAFTPPAEGRMLLVPLGGQSISESLILDHGATPLTPGPLDGSWVVEGKREALTNLFYSNSIVVLAAPAAICSSEETSS